MKNKSGVDADANQLKCTMATGIVMDSQTSKLRSSAKTAPGENAKTIKARRSDGFYRRYIDKVIKVRDGIYFRKSIVSTFGNQLVQLHVFENLLYMSICVHAAINWYHISICFREFTRIANSKKQNIA